MKIHKLRHFLVSALVIQVSFESLFCEAGVLGKKRKISRNANNGAKKRQKNSRKKRTIASVGKSRVVDPSQLDPKVYDFSKIIFKADFC